MKEGHNSKEARICLNSRKTKKRMISKIFKHSNDLPKECQLDI